MPFRSGCAADAGVDLEGLLAVGVDGGCLELDDEVPPTVVFVAFRGEHQIDSPVTAVDRAKGPIRSGAPADGRR
jgi:hypothetical protein